jgi:hypothetical protein
MILTVLGWLAFVPLLAMSAASVGYAAYRRLALKEPSSFLPSLAFAAAGFAAAAGAGGSSIAGIVLAAAVTGFAAWAGRLWTARGWRELAGDVRADLAWAAGFLSWRPGKRPRAAAAEEGSAPAAVAEAAATRSIPSVMEDPALGLAPEPAELTAGNIPAPAPYAALAAFIAGFEPEDDMALRMFMEGSAAGSVMVADAWHHFADTCLNSVGLDPAFVAGILEAGDSSGVHGTLLAQVSKRLSVIYGAVQEWVAAHGPLPHKAREWLTGDM